VGLRRLFLSREEDLRVSVITTINFKEKKSHQRFIELWVHFQPQFADLFADLFVDRLKKMMSFP